MKLLRLPPPASRRLQARLPAALAAPALGALTLGALTLGALTPGTGGALGAQATKPAASLDEIGALLAGRYDNSAQVARGSGEHPPPQLVTIAIEPTRDPDFEIWRVHMDVEPEVAEAAGSATSLDAVWAIEVARSARGTELVPYTPKPSLDADAAQASTFDRKDWLALSACSLFGEFRATKIVAAVPPEEMCVAASMGIGGKRAFLPSWISRQDDALQVEIVYFGKPWTVEARRLQ